MHSTLSQEGGNEYNLGPLSDILGFGTEKGRNANRRQLLNIGGFGLGLYIDIDFRRDGACFLKDGVFSWGDDNATLGFEPSATGGAEVDSVSEVASGNSMFNGAT